MDKVQVALTFVEFLESKFGAILGIAFLSMLVNVWLIYRHWDVIGGFLKETIDTTNPASTARAILWFQVIISNTAIWPIWMVLSVMDNIDNAAGQPFTLVDIPGGVLTLYGLANGIAAASGMMKMYTDKKNGEKKEGE